MFNPLDDLDRRVEPKMNRPEEIEDPEVKYRNMIPCEHCGNLFDANEFDLHQVCLIEISNIISKVSII